MLPWLGKTSLGKKKKASADHQLVVVGPLTYLTAAEDQDLRKILPALPIKQADNHHSK